MSERPTQAGCPHGHDYAEDCTTCLERRISGLDALQDSDNRVIIGLHEEIASLKAQLAEAQKDCARIIAVFAHTHVSSNDGTDTCKQCGLDLRNPVHFAAPTYKKE